MKPIDKAALGAVSESTGRNESERKGGPESGSPGGRVRIRRTKAVHRDADWMTSLGALAGWERQHVDKDTPSNWRNPPGRAGKSVQQCRSYNQVSPGKSIEDQRVAEGFVVAMKRGNARGAKEPYCWHFFQQHGRQG